MLGVWMPPVIAQVRMDLPKVFIDRPRNGVGSPVIRYTI
jgi:hypothetical protein